ncbi:MAG: PEGA domain-containing protein [Spirochaetia bacterium]|nr:PEGA domain-containing protein [Spirochaetia bacterium]
MKKTEKMVNENNWDGLLSIKSEISTNFSTLTDVLNKIETTDPDNTSILNLHTNSWEIVSEVFNGNLSNMDNLNKLLIIDKNMTSNNEILQKYKNDLPEGYFDDLSGNSEVSEYLNNWGSMLITIIQNKILTGKEVETEKDIQVIKQIIEKAEKDNRLEELQTYLESEAKKEKVPPSILFSLSLVYGRKGLVKEEYKIIEELELMPGSLVVNSDPVGSTVLLDGEEIGVTPFTILKIDVGDYELVVQKKDYKEKISAITIEPGKPESLMVTLTLLTGSLQLINLTQGTEVSIDRIIKTVKYSRIESIKPGSHQILISREGYLDKKERFYIQGNKQTTIDGSLSFIIPYAEIKIDGKESDWDILQPVIVDNLNDSNGPDGTDIHKVFIATDGTYLYTKINLADGAPSEKPLFYALGIESQDKSFSRLLFTQYDRSWTTGVDRWTTGHYHEQIGKGKIRVRNGIIEARYKLKDIGLTLDQQILLNAWNDSSGQSFDYTSQMNAVWIDLMKLTGSLSIPANTKINNAKYTVVLDNNDFFLDGYIKIVSERWQDNQVIFNMTDIQQGKYYLYAFIDTDNSGGVPESGDYYSMYNAPGLLTPKEANISFPSADFSGI